RSRIFSCSLRLSAGSSRLFTFLWTFPFSQTGSWTAGGQELKKCSALFLILAFRREGEEQSLPRLIFQIPGKGSLFHLYRCRFAAIFVEWKSLHVPIFKVSE